MHNAFGPRELYTIRGDMCYDNKIMVNAALPDRQILQSVSMNVADSDKPEAPRRRFWPRLRCKRLFDITVYILLVILILLIEAGIIPNIKLGFTCRDPKYSYPFRGDTVTSTILLSSCFVGSLVAIILVEALRERSLKKVCVGTVWHYYKELMLGVAFVLTLTEVVKIMVGEPRPHFFDSCEPAELANCRPDTFIYEWTCTNTRTKPFFQTDVTRSFPSGHTSLSVYTALFLSYLVQTRVPSAAVPTMVKPLLIVLLLSWASFCGLTRITDRRHHWWDVLAGAVIAAGWALHSLVVLHRKERPRKKIFTTNTSTTTLLDIKNKDATSVII